MTITFYKSDNWISVTLRGRNVGDFATLEAALRFVRARGFAPTIVEVV